MGVFLGFSLFDVEFVVFVVGAFVIPSEVCCTPEGNGWVPDNGGMESFGKLLLGISGRDMAILKARGCL